VKDHSSGREGMRLVVELKRGANPQVVLNQLYKHTQLQDSFGVIMLSLVDGVPRTLNLAEMIGYYVDHQIDVVTRRTRYELKKAEERDHIVKGLLIALDNLDAVIKVIRGSQDAEEGARQADDAVQAQRGARRTTSWTCRSRRLTRLARAELEQEHKDLLARIRYLKGLLKDPKKIRAVITDELLEIKKKFANPRRTQLKADEGDLDVHGPDRRGGRGHHRLARRAT
jgi:DNA gyrase subunit A